MYNICIYFLTNSFFFSAGGLVTAVAPVVISGNGIWVGWPGMHMENPNEPIPESDPNDRTPTAGLLSRKVSQFSVFNSDRYLFICIQEKITDGIFLILILLSL